MDALKLFLRGLAALLIAGAVGRIIGTVLEAFLSTSSQHIPGIVGIGAMAVTAWLLYPRVIGTPRRWGNRKTAEQANQE